MLCAAGAAAAAGGASARGSSGSATADVLDSVQVDVRGDPGTQAAAAHAASRPCVSEGAALGQPRRRRRCAARAAVGPAQRGAAFGQKGSDGAPSLLWPGQQERGPQGDNLLNPNPIPDPNPNPSPNPDPDPDPDPKPDSEGDNRGPCRPLGSFVRCESWLETAPLDGFTAGCSSCRLGCQASALGCLPLSPSSPGPWLVSGLGQAASRQIGSSWTR